MSRKNKTNTKLTKPSNAPKRVKNSKAIVPYKPKSNGKDIVVTRARQNLNLKQISQVAPFANNAKENARNAALMMLQPFRAYEMDMKSGLPFTRVPQAVVGLWSRSVTTVTEVAWTGTANTYGMNLQIFPWAQFLFKQAATIDSSGVTTLATTSSDPAYGFMLANASLATVGYQGVRIRNTTAVNSLQGETVIGRGQAKDVADSTYAQQRNRSTAYVHTNADPGVVCEMTYVGNMFNQMGAAGQVVDYEFVAPSASVGDDHLGSMFINTMSNSPQTFDVEVVTYYIFEPFGATSSFWSPSKYCVDLDEVDLKIDEALSKLPLYTSERTCFRDDGIVDSVLGDIATVFKGASIVYDWGRTAVNWIGDAFSSLFGTDLHRAVHAIMYNVPDQNFDEVVALIKRFEHKQDLIDYCLAHQTSSFGRPTQPRIFNEFVDLTPSRPQLPSNTPVLRRS